MTLPASGPISLNDVAAELGLSSANFSLSRSEVRALAGILSGPIGLIDLHGKSAYTPMTVTLGGGGAYWYPYPNGGYGSTSPIDLQAPSVSGGSGVASTLYIITGTTGSWTSGPAVSGNQVNGNLNVLGVFWPDQTSASFTVIARVTDTTGHVVDSNPQTYTLTFPSGPE